MAYLDNSTVTVDAILTKQGRRLLAQNRPLNISYFTLTDSGIDYTTWNPDHPSGSAYYGESIEKLPSLEAMSNAAYFMMRNTLITLPKGTVAMPGITNLFNWDWGKTFTKQSWMPTMINGVNSGGYTLIFTNSNDVNVHGATGETLGANLLQFVQEQNLNDAVSYQVGEKFTLSPKPNNGGQKTLVPILVDNTYGVFATFTLTIDNNSDKIPVTLTGMGD